MRKTTSTPDGHSEDGKSRREAARRTPDTARTPGIGHSIKYGIAKVRGWIMPVFTAGSIVLSPGCQQMTESAVKGVVAGVGTVVDKTFEGLGKLGSKAVNFVEKKVSRLGDKLDKYYGKVFRSKPITLSSLREAYENKGGSAGKRKRILAEIYEKAIIPAGQSSEFKDNLANIPPELQKKYEEWYMAAVALEYLSTLADSMKTDADDLEDDADDMLDDQGLAADREKLEDAEDLEKAFQESGDPNLDAARKARKKIQSDLNTTESEKDSQRKAKLKKEGETRDVLYELRPFVSGLRQQETEAHDAFLGALADYNEQTAE